MKNKVKIIGIISILLFVINSNLSSQDTKAEYNKNTVFITVGSFGILGGANLSYERYILKTQKSILSSLWLRAGGGYWYNWSDYGQQYYLTAVGLLGRKKSHLEYSLGITGLYDNVEYRISLSNYKGGYYDNAPTKWEFVDIYPIFNIGYRYQKPQGHFVFRTGLVSTPAAIYVSFGYVF